MKFLEACIVFYLFLFLLWIISFILLANEGWKRNGLVQSPVQAKNTAKEMLLSDHWTKQIFVCFSVVVFFSFPVFLYQRFYKKNKNATLLDPTGFLRM